MILATFVASACASPPGKTATGDASVSSDGPPVDAQSDATVDATSDARTECALSFPACSSPLDLGLCRAANGLAAGVLLDQNTASGGYGDCAASASGTGGPNLYYRVTIPPMKYLFAGVSPSNGQDALVRILANCAALGTHDSARGGAQTQGAAAVCSEQIGLLAAPHEVVIAVGRYSGEEACLTLPFALTTEFHNSIASCAQAVQNF